MKFMMLLKSKWAWAAVVVIAVGGGWYYRNLQANKGPFYETQAVETGDVVQTVEVTGQIKPAQRINLSFKNTGTFATVSVKVGDQVAAGQLLAELGASDVRYSVRLAEANLATASANLNAQLAGQTPETIRIAEADVQKAQAAYDKTLSDLAITRLSVEDDYRVAGIAVDTAKKNLDNGVASANQTVSNAYDSLRNTCQTSISTLQTAILDGDAIIGVDNTAANDSYETVLGINDHPALDAVRPQYAQVKLAKTAAETAVHALSSASSPADIKNARSLTQDALQKMQTYLELVQRVLVGTVVGSGITAADLATKKTTIETDRTNVSSQLSSLISAYQTVINAELSLNTSSAQLQNAYDTALANLSIADHDRTNNVQAAETNVAVNLASLNAAKAALALKKAPPRSVDVASLRAQVLNAATALSQAQDRLKDVQIYAPVAGIVSDIVPNLGEQVAANVTVISMIGSEDYSIEALIPEADISKVKVGQPVTMTLDAYGDQVKFTGTVLAENPDQNKVQDAIYYKTYVSIDAQGRDVKPGMTANLTVQTGQSKGVLFVPTRAIVDRNGQPEVRVLVNGVAQLTAITVGLRGDEGKTEILSGLKAGDAVIVGELTAAEYKLLPKP